MGAAKRKKIADTQVDLPRQAQVGDRIRLKPERMVEYAAAIKKAGWGDVNLYAVRTVTRKDNFSPGGGARLFVEGPPHCFGATDVILAWNSDLERREFLRTKGWKV